MNKPTSAAKAPGGGSRSPATSTLRSRKEARDRRNAEIRTEVFDHYGWICACCGAVPKRPEIDHIDGKGRAHRIELFGTHNASGPRFWLWLIRNGFPGGYQTLCGRCNRAKGATDTCPLHAQAA